MPLGPLARLRSWAAERLSIRKRLTIWYAAMLLFVLSVLSLVTFLVAQNQIQSNLNADIRVRAISIASALQHEEYTSAGGSAVLQPTATPGVDVSPTVVITTTPGQQATVTPTPLPNSTPDPATNAAIQRQLTVSVPDALGHLDLGFEVLDTRGRLKYLAPSLNGRSLPINYAVVDGALRGQAGAYSALSDGSQLSVYAQPIMVDARVLARDGAPGATEGVAPPSTVSQQVIGVVLVAKSQDDVKAAMNTLLRLIAISELAAIIVASLGGWLIAENGLRPVATVTRAAADIARNTNGADLGTRVYYRGPMDEVGDLVATFNEMLTSIQDTAATHRRFVADASHELRAPLTVIRGNLELLRQAANLPAERRAEVLDDAYLEAERMTALVNDLLLLARVDAAAATPGGGERALREQLSGRRERVEMDSLVMDLRRAGESYLRAGRKQIRLDVTSIAPVEVMADPGQLRQLGMILLDNAIKYTPNGGAIQLAVNQVGPLVAPLVAMTVKDTGIGIGPNDLPRIFNRFYRADQARKRDQHGSGLGLAIARWIAEAHQGEIKVESEPGKGTTFTVLLPMARRPVNEQSSPHAATGRRKRGGRPRGVPALVQPFARLAETVSRRPSDAPRVRGSAAPPSRPNGKR